ncbi:MAG: peptidylprolyl isomerase [Muribaculaceae bacterium]|nr:peptidylprolyl isomerase [Muribaculaceae bacterium]
MNKRFLTGAVALLALTSVFAKQDGSDPVLLTVDGQKVPLSEFEYLYNKNNHQQAEPQTREQYFDMFLLYKLKVADAISAGLDTTATFMNEYNQYRRELASPYLVDKDVEAALIKLGYEMMKENVDVSHIMLPHDNESTVDIANKLRLDSIRREVLAGRADFDEMAVKFSVDRMAKYNGNAHMGMVRGTSTYPYSFVEAAYTTPVGGISPVIDSGFGYHIVRPEKRMPNDGEVKARHILKLTRALPDSLAEVKKIEIDRIYQDLRAGASFDSLARVESEDPGSARNGGDLGFFGRGMMVPEFEQVAFSLKDGEFSEPFKSAFGYHIILREDHRGVPSFEDAIPTLKNEIMNDERGDRPRRARLESLRKRFNAHIDEQGMDKMLEVVRNNGGYDSVAIAKLATMNTPVAVLDGGEVTAGELVAAMGLIAKVSDKVIAPYFRETASRLLDEKVVNHAIDCLPQENAEYRNLLNEYHDGILLFEISNRNVWDRATKDKEGLEKFFKSNKANYSWNAPKYKGYIIFATTDSVSQLADSYLKENKIASDSLVKELRKKFGKEIKVEKVLAAKGENAIVDAAAFGGDKPSKLGRWAYFFAYDGKVIDQPEEAADVRGAATSDYQALLEKEWIKSLKAKHKYKVNKKLLQSLK